MMMGRSVSRGLARGGLCQPPVCVGVRVRVPGLQAGEVRRGAGVAGGEGRGRGPAGLGSRGAATTAHLLLLQLLPVFAWKPGDLFVRAGGVGQPRGFPHGAVPAFVAPPRLSWQRGTENFYLFLSLTWGGKA